jgi:hypothetical protein
MINNTKYTGMPHRIAWSLGTIVRKKERPPKRVLKRWTTDAEGNQVDRWDAGTYEQCRREHRLVEYWAMFNARHGWFPDSDIRDIDIPQLRQITPINFNIEIKPRHDAIGQTCLECQKHKPLTHDHFHGDGKMKTGFKSVCIKCKRKSDQIRYEQQKTA